MSDIITIRMLQTPQILLNGETIHFPFRKAEALIYYLAVKKSAVREEVSSLLWADTPEAVALKNLRHTIYICKKTCGLELILAPQKKRLILNPDYRYEIDYDLFTMESRLSSYQGEFLQNFYIRNSPEFEVWAEQERILCRRKYLQLLSQAMNGISSDRISEIEDYFSRYTNIEPFDEQIYLRMMQVYMENGQYYKGIRVYQALCDVLRSELQVSPSRELKELNRKLLEALSEAPGKDPAPGGNLPEGREYSSEVPAGGSLSGDIVISDDHTAVITSDKEILLRFLSVFPEEVPLELLEKATQTGSFMLLKMLKELMERGFLKETTAGGSACLSFRKASVQKEIYGQLSASENSFFIPRLLPAMKRQKAPPAP